MLKQSIQDEIARKVSDHTCREALKIAILHLETAGSRSIWVSLGGELRCAVLLNADNHEIGRTSEAGGFLVRDLLKTDNVFNVLSDAGNTIWSQANVDRLKELRGL